MDENFEIRIASANDAEEIRSIYAPYVENTAISFEYEVPTVEEFERRIKNTLSLYPYLAAVEDGKIIGYTYAGKFRTRAAYKYSVELSIYVEKGHRRSGVGRALYTEMEKLLKLQNIRKMCAGVTSADAEDEYLTFDSERFHKKMGFTKVGSHPHCGYKFGRWYNIFWVEKDIGCGEVKPFISFPELMGREKYPVDYEMLIKQLSALTEGVPHPTANLANASALLWEHLPELNWAGFYLMENGGLVLGPFQGKTACIEIAVGKGVCGTAVAEDRTQLVPNVHEFPGHIACDSASNSEIVVPIHKDGKVWGVLDIDSPEYSRFSEKDKAGLEAFVKVLEKNI